MNTYIIAIYDNFSAENKQYMITATGWKEAIAAAYVLKQGPDSDPEVKDTAFIMNAVCLKDIKLSFYDMELCLSILEIVKDVAIAVKELE